MPNQVEGTVLSDVVKHEGVNRSSRESMLVDESQTLVIGSVCRSGANGRKVALGAFNNCVQTVDIEAPTSGTFRLRIRKSDGSDVMTDSIVYGANAATIETEIEVQLGVNTVSVGGTTIMNATFTFDGADYEKKAQPLIEIDVSNLVGTDDAKITMTTEGGPAGTGAGADEVQLIAIVGTLTAGTYDVTFEDSSGDEKVLTVQWDDATGDVQTSLDTLLGTNAVIAGGTVHTAGTLTFSGGEYEKRSHRLVKLDVTSLIGNTSAAISRTTAGGPAGDSKADSICLVAITTASSALTTKTVFLVRNAVVDEQQLDFGDGDKAQALVELEARGISAQPEADKALGLVGVSVLA